MGVLLFAAVALVAVRSPVLSRNDRELFFRLFQGRETRLLRLLGVLTPGSGAQGAP